AVMKKKVLSLTIGPPNDPETCFSESGTSTGLIEASVLGVTQDDTEGAQNPSVLKDFACISPGRAMNSPSPWKPFVPDLVTMFNAGPAVQPNSEEKALLSTVISCTAPRGTVAIAVWRPHASSLLAPSSVTVVCRRPPTPVTKYVAFTNRSP